MSFKKLFHRFLESRNPAPDISPADWSGIRSAVSAGIAASNIPLPAIPEAKYAKGQEFRYGSDTVRISMVSVMTIHDVFPGEPPPEYQYRVFVNGSVDWMYESQLDSLLDTLAGKALGRVG